MIRPDDLPDYDDPPLNEVAIGIQFAPPRGYQQIYAKNVWELFKKDFPEVKEQDAIPPVFETFGVSGPSPSRIELRSGATHDRFWFLSKSGSELIQFQQDRLLHNWRKIEDNFSSYPRFDVMLPKFESEINSLIEYYSSQFSLKKLEINQCELTYVNHIALSDTNEFSKWVHFVSVGSVSFEEISFATREILDRGGELYGRLICVCKTALDKDAKPIIELRLTVRGMPSDSGVSAAVDFFAEGRDTIVRRFDELTTEFAHKAWGKK